MTREELQSENRALKQQINQLYKLINGFKSERFVAAQTLVGQPTLFDLEDAPTEQKTPKEDISYTRSKKKHPGRKELPNHLPVKEIIIEPRRCRGCTTNFPLGCISA